MKYVILAYGPINDPNPKINGQYVMSYDPEAHDGRGDVVFTIDPKRAKKFSSGSAALKFSLQVPSKRPLREDGLANRPLRAFTLEIAPIKEPER